MSAKTLSRPARISRPVMQYRGGKWKLATWVIAHFPPHRIYTETFGGAASVLLRKEPSFGEVYNDLDRRVVNVFRVLRDPEKSQRLAFQLSLTPYARSEYASCFDGGEIDDVEWARRTIVLNHLGFGSIGLAPGKGPESFQARCWNRTQNGATLWSNFPRLIETFTQRLKCVVIECKPAVDVMVHQDGPDTLHYVDPPYVMCTRGMTPRPDYDHEMTDDDHRQLSEVLHSLKGMVVLSGYASDLYEELYADWQTARRRSMALCRTHREEVLWMSPRTIKRLGYRWEQLRARGF